MEFPGLLKKENVEIPGVNWKRCRISRGGQVKTHVEFPWVLVFDLGISKWCHTILLNFQEWKLVFSGISKCRSQKSKISRAGFQKIISSTLPCLVFFWNSPLSFKKERALLEEAARLSPFSWTQYQHNILILKWILEPEF